MRRRIITLSTAVGLALASLVYLQAKEPKEPGEHGPKHEHGPGPHHMMGNPLDHLSKDLGLTDDQKTKVQPIIDQAKPQMKAIHEEAMQKMHALMESTGAQIRPMLTPEQQQKFDAMKKAHEDMRKAHEEMENAKKL
jgi:Spy/CpxP family protein refolding chaperone